MVQRGILGLQLVIVLFNGLQVCGMPQNNTLLTSPT